MELNPLTALSPIDGRYARQTDALRDIFSECAFMNARVRVEVEWLISLSEAGFAELPHLSDHARPSCAASPTTSRSPTAKPSRKSKRRRTMT